MSTVIQSNEDRTFILLVSFDSFVAVLLSVVLFPLGFTALGYSCFKVTLVKSSMPSNQLSRVFL